MYNEKQSLADKSRADAKKYFRDNDPIDAKARELGNKKLIELNKIALEEMALNNNMNYNTFMMYGGNLKKKYIKGGGLGTNKLNLSESNVLKPNTTFNQDDNLNNLPFNEVDITSMNKLPNSVTTDLGIKEKSEFANPDLSQSVAEGYNPNKFSLTSPTGLRTLKTPGSLGYDTSALSKTPGAFDIKAPTYDTEAGKFIAKIKGKYNYNPNSKKFDINSLAGYGNLAGQLVGDGYNVLQGLKGGDPVNFDRMNSKYQFIDPRGAMTAANRGITSAYNSAKNAVRNTATSAGEYLANMGSLSSKEGMDRATAMTSIKGQYDAGNIQGLNQSNLTKDQYNAQIQMKESDTRQQEQDAARSAISRGLSDIGSKIGSFNNEKSARNNQNNLITLMSSNGYKLITGKNGELSFEKDGQSVPYNVAINSVLQSQPKK